MGKEEDKAAERAHYELLAAQAAKEAKEKEEKEDD
jgi:hypothetical protein